jgi:hypothetical protein
MVLLAITWWVGSASSNRTLCGPSVGRLISARSRNRRTSIIEALLLLAEHLASRAICHDRGTTDDRVGRILWEPRLAAGSHLLRTNFSVRANGNDSVGASGDHSSGSLQKAALCAELGTQFAGATPVEWLLVVLFVAFFFGAWWVFGRRPRQLSRDTIMKSRIALELTANSTYAAIALAAEPSATPCPCQRVRLRQLSWN